jgi:hypothetical protein
MRSRFPGSLGPLLNRTCPRAGVHPATIYSSFTPLLWNQLDTPIDREVMSHVRRIVLWAGLTTMRYDLLVGLFTCSGQSLRDTYPSCPLRSALIYLLPSIY